MRRVRRAALRRATPTGDPHRVLSFPTDLSKYVKLSWTGVPLTGPLTLSLITHRVAPPSDPGFDRWMMTLWDNVNSATMWEVEHSGSPGNGEVAEFVFGGGTSVHGNIGVTEDSGPIPGLGSWDKTWQLIFSWNGVGFDAGKIHIRNLTDAPTTWYHVDGHESASFASDLIPIVDDGTLWVGGNDGGSNADSAQNPYPGLIGNVMAWGVDLWDGGAGVLGTDPLWARTSDLQAVSPADLLFGTDFNVEDPAAMVDLAGTGTVVCEEITASLDPTGIAEWTFDGVAPTGGGTAPAALSGSMHGAGAATGALKAPAGLSGSASGNGAGTAFLTAPARIVGSMGATGAAAGTVSTPGGASVSGSMAATGQAVGAATAPSQLTGASAGTGSASGAVRAPSMIQGASGATGAATGALVTPTGLSGAAPAAGTASGILSTNPGIAGAMAAAGSSSGQPTATPNATGSASGAGSATGALTAAPRLSGPMAGQGAATGNIQVPGTALIVGQAAATGAASATASVPAGLLGSVAGAGSALGALSALSWITGATAASAALLGQPSVPQPVSGSMAASGSAAGLLTASPALVGQAAGASGATGAPRAAPQLMAEALGSGSASGALRAVTGLSGAAAGRGSSTGNVGGQPLLTGALVGAGGMAGALEIGVTQWPSTPGRIAVTTLDGRLAQRPSGTGRMRAPWDTTSG